MIISRTLAKSRISHGVRPSWLAAWGLVALDFAVLVALFVALWNPVMAFVYLTQPSNAVTMLGLFLVVFVPMQLVLVISSLWATRSRYVEETPDG